MERMTTEQIVEAITDRVNSMSRDEGDKFAVLMAQEHRTLQQSFTRLCMQWLEHLAAMPDNRIDLRNEAARDMAKTVINSAEVREMYGSEPSRYLPTI